MSGEAGRAPAPLRILDLSTASLLPPRTGSDLRVVHLARGLAELGHRVDAVSWIAGNYPRRREAEGEGLRLEQRHAASLNMALVADRLRLAPITELPVYFRALRRAVAALTRGGGAGGRYDIVQCEQPWFAYLYEAAAPGTTVIYSAHNIESDWWAPRLRRYPLGAFFQRRLETHERTAATRCAGVVACSEADAAAIEARWGIASERVCVAPNGFDAAALKPADAAARAAARARLGVGPDERVALFIGARNEPNAEAVRAILRHIAPHPACAGMRFFIVGRVDELSSGPYPARVVFTGHVADVAPYLQAADVGLNPVSSGSGSNVKLIEYCAAGLAVVTTEFGLRGYEALRPWLAVREIGDFAEAAAADGGAGPPPAEMLEPFSWRRSAAVLADFYRRIIAISAISAISAKAPPNP